MKSTMTAQTQCACQCNRFEKVCTTLDSHGNDPAKLIPILQGVQAEYGYLPEDLLAYVASSLGIPAARVYGVATFYAHFALEPKGKYVFRICDGTACHVKGSMDLYDALRKRLDLTDDEQTTTDMMFTVETVSCLGACGLAPAVVMNEDVHGMMTPERTVALVDEILENEGNEK